jgi:cation diffusion facilitator family transporter
LGRSRDDAYGVTDRQRHASVKKVLWWILGANWLVAVAKLVLGLIAGSTAMTADGMHSFIDGASNIIGLVAMHFASQPADAEHPYGHQKFEALASLAIGVMIGMGVLELGRMAFNSLLHGTHPQVGVLQIVVMVTTLVVNLVVTRIEAAQGRKLKSSLLLADAAHTLSDVFVTIAVIVSLGLTLLGVNRVDGIVALGVLGFVAYTGWRIIRQSVGILADSSRIEPEKVRALLEAITEIREVRSVRSRGLEGAAYVDLIIHVDPHLSVKSAHEVTNRVEEDIKRTWPEVIDVVVHVEPLGS